MRWVPTWQRFARHSTGQRTDMSIFGPECELCEAAKMSEWFYEDDEMWIAECESCGVPMVVTLATSSGATPAT